MPANRHKLTVLKEKIINMQHELSHMQNEQKEIERSLEKGRQCVKTPQRMHSGSYSKQFKSPSYFMRTNPVSFSENYAKKNENCISPSNKMGRTSGKRQLLPELREIMATIDRPYCRSLESSEEKEREISPVRQSISPRHRYSGKRYEFSEYGMRSYFPNERESKKRTFKGEKRDPVLDPEQYKEAGIRIVNSKSKSPENPYTRHPQSKENFFYHKRPQKTIFLQRKGNLKHEPMSKELLSSPLGQTVPIKFDTTPRPKRKRSQRKHFTKFFQEFYNNQLLLE